MDWRDRRHWRCNNNVHPSRHGTYDEISMHPYETIFIKSSWHVGEPFVDKYTNWVLAQVRGWVGGGWGEVLGKRVDCPEVQFVLPGPPSPPPPSPQAAGADTTEGEFDEVMYRYAVSGIAQESHHVDRCYKVLQQW